MKIENSEEFSNLIREILEWDQLSEISKKLFRDKIANLKSVVEESITNLSSDRKNGICWNSQMNQFVYTNLNKRDHKYFNDIDFIVRRNKINYYIPNVLKAKVIFGNTELFLLITAIYTYYVLFLNKGREKEKEYAFIIDNIIISNLPIEEKIKQIYCSRIFKITEMIKNDDSRVFNYFPCCIRRKNT